MDEKVYLGDGVYARFDGFGIVITTENGLRETNRIVFDGDTLVAFEWYVSALRKRTSATSGEKQGGDHG